MSLNKRGDRYLVHLLIAILFAYPLFTLVDWIMVKVPGNGSIFNSITATACFFAGVYLGRYFSFAFRYTNTYIHSALVAGFTILLFVLIALVNILVNKLSGPNNSGSRLLPPKYVLLILVFFFLGIVAGILIKLVLGKIQQRIELAEAEAAQSKSELRLLQSQLSPHFLFNTLNNLYGMSMTEADKVPSLLLRLSELLRYTVYDAKEIYVPLSSEVNYLTNYLEFEKIRLGERLELSCAIDQISDNAITIAPMLLIVFVENAFKHASNTRLEKIQIQIALQTNGNAIHFSVWNSCPIAEADDSNTLVSGGMGLENVKKRLALLYKGAYDLTIKKDTGFYIVTLRIHAKGDKLSDKLSGR